MKSYVQKLDFNVPGIAMMETWLVFSVKGKKKCLLVLHEALSKIEHSLLFKLD